MQSQRPAESLWAVPLSVAAFGLIVLFITAGNYGIFRDELYYLDCTRHLDWGFVDHPPLSIALLKSWVAVFGDSTWSIRVPPALSGALLIFLTGLMAARLGGSTMAVLLASLATLVAPVYLIINGFYSMNAYDLVFWGLLWLVLILIMTGHSQRLWLLFGLILGLAFQNKIGVAALVVGLIPALFISGRAADLGRREFWAGMAIAILLFLPHVLWQMSEGWPTLEFIRNATATKITALSLPQFFTEQILLLNPVLLPLWLLGLGALLFWKPLRPYRGLGVLWLIIFLFLGLQRSKPYYLAPAFPPLLAAGACALSALLRHSRMRWVSAVIMVAGGIFVAPLSLRILPPESLVSYMDKIGIKPSAGENTGETALPQYFADCFGWENVAVTVAGAYYALPDTLKQECAILTRNYGEAGAINYYRDRHRLPRAISQHNSHFLWGPGDITGETILAVNYSADELRAAYDSVTLVATVVSPWAMPYETDAPIYLCRGLKIPWKEAWQAGKLII